MRSKTAAQKILEFYDSLKNIDINLPEKYRLINPFTNDDWQRIAQITHRFYRQYYHDNKRRFMILGSSLARRGAGQCLPVCRLKMLIIYKKTPGFL